MVSAAAGNLGLLPPEFFEALPRLPPQCCPSMAGSAHAGLAHAAGSPAGAMV